MGEMGGKKRKMVSNCLPPQASQVVIDEHWRRQLECCSTVRCWYVHFASFSPV